MGGFVAGFLGGIFLVFVVIFIICTLLYELKVKPLLKNAQKLPEPDIKAEKTNYEFTLKSLDGSEVAGSTLKQKIVFLNFWATWCGPCRAEMPSIEKLYQYFKNRDDVLVLCVSLDENPEKVKEFVSKNGYTMPVFQIAHDKGPEEFKTQGIPATFVLLTDGTIILRHIGAANWASEKFIRYFETLSLKV